MTIDWLTVSAQIVNFLILVWLLKRFLYKPVLNAMNQREQRIREQLDDARNREATADERAARYEEETKALAQQRDAVLVEAEEDAKARRKALIATARQEVNETRTQWQAQLEDEKNAFLNELQRSAASMIQEIARNAVRELADAELEALIIDRFLLHLKGLDKAACRALTKNRDALRVATAFELETGVRQELTHALHECFAANLDVDYEREPTLLCGIELRGDGQRLSWHVNDYLADLTERMDAKLASHRTSGDRAH